MYPASYRLGAFVLTLFITASLGAKEIASPTPTPGTPSAETSPKISFGLLLDSYYTYNFSNSANPFGWWGPNVGYFNPTNRFFTLGLAEFSLDMKQGGGTIHLSTDYGEDANSIQAKDDHYFPFPGAFNLWEAYAVYHPGDWTFRVGKFTTHLGLEVLESNQDWNYTRSLLFSSPVMPRYHLGVSAGYASPDKTWAVTGYMDDGIDDQTMITGQNKYYGLRLSFWPGTGWIVQLNGLTGPVKGANNNVFANSYAECTAQWKAAPDLSLALDVLWNQEVSNDPTLPPSTGFYGMALYGRYQLAPGWALAVRLEETVNLNQTYGFPDPITGFYNEVTCGEVEVREATLTLERAFTANVLARLEARYDYALSGGQTYAPGDGFYSSGSDDQATGTASVVVAF